MPTPATQPPRVGLLAGQALERSDNPATMRRQVQPLRVGLSKPSAYRRVNTQINPNHQSSLPEQQALRLGLLAGQALGRSANPAIVRRKNATP